MSCEGCNIHERDEGEVVRREGSTRWQNSKYSGCSRYLAEGRRMAGGQRAPVSDFDPVR